MRPEGARRAARRGRGLIRLATDNDLNAHISRGLRVRLPQIEVVSVRDVGLARAEDSMVLDWAADEGCVVVTHDVSTMTAAAHYRLARNEPMRGVIVVPQRLAIGEAVRRLEKLLREATADDFDQLVHFL